MQVLSCQRVASLIAAPAPMDAARRAPSVVKAAVCHRQRGFTLIELLVTLTIATILMMIAVPSFKNISLSNKLTTSANDMVTAISIARMEAVKRNASTQLCSNSSSANSSSDLGNACGTETGAVWATASGGVTQVLAGTPNLNLPLQVSGNLAALRFNAQGLASKVGETGPYGDVVVDICTSQMSSNNHRVITMAAGSILVTTSSSGSCP